MARLSILLFSLTAVLVACAPEAPTASEAVVEPASDPAPTPAAPSDAAYQGAGLARQVCAQCHHVTAGPAPDNLPAASFVEIANREQVSEDSIRTWLTTTHPTMPNFMFDAQTVEEMTAYIMTLRKSD